MSNVLVIHPSDKTTDFLKSGFIWKGETQIMDTNELRQSVINLMSKTIVDVKPEIVIRRLQNDEAFAVYANVDSPDAISNVIRNIINNNRWKNVADCV